MGDAQILDLEHEHRVAVALRPAAAMDGGGHVAHAQVEVGEVVMRHAAIGVPAPQHMIDAGRDQRGVVRVVGVVHGDDVGHQRRADIGVVVGDRGGTAGGLEQEAGVAEKGQPRGGTRRQGGRPQGGGHQPGRQSGDREAARGQGRRRQGQPAGGERQHQEFAASQVSSGPAASAADRLPARCRPHARAEQGDARHRGGGQAPPAGSVPASRAGNLGHPTRSPRCRPRRMTRKSLTSAAATITATP